jgi:hypothetical protein
VPGLAGAQEHAVHRLLAERGLDGALAQLPHPVAAR